MPRRIAGPWRSSCQTPCIRSDGARAEDLRPRPRRRLRAEPDDGADASLTPPPPSDATSPGTGSGGSSPFRRRVARACLTPTGGGERPASENSLAPGVCSAGARSADHPRNEPGEPSWEMRPACMAITRSATARHRSRRCSASTIVVSHSWLSRRSSPISSSAATGSSWDVGSSSSTTRGLPASAAPRATRCFSPPESSCVERSSRWSTPSANATSSTPRATSAELCPPLSSASASSARTELITSCVSGSWKSTPTTPPRRAGPCSRVSRPQIRTRPAKRPPWKCGASPQAARSSVDLPCPERPASRQNSPGAMARLTPSSAGASTAG